MTCGKEDIPLDQIGPNFIGGEQIGEKEMRKKKRRKGMREKLHILSRFSGNRTVGSDQSKRQSWSMHRELRVGTKISRFRQAPRGRGFSPTRFNFCLRVI